MRAVSSLFVAVAVIAGCRGRPDAPRRPDIILVSVDTLRADFLGYAGRASADTPNLDRLARNGTTFVNAFTPMPRTTPAVASLLTGLWPKHHGSQEVGQPMERGETLAAVLGQHGYHTAGVSANFAASPSHNLTRGFHAFVSSETIKSSYGESIYRHGTTAPPSAMGWAGATTEQALVLADETPEEAPLFLWVHYFDPHVVYRPPSPWNEEVDAPLCRELYEEYAVRRPAESWRVFGDFEGVATRALEDCQALYDGEIAYTDRQIGSLLEGLERRDNPDGMLVIVTSDHGENFGEGGAFFEHGDNVKDASAAVPLVFHGRDVASGRVDAGSVSLVDIVPTLFEWLSLSPDTTRVDGVSLAERLSENGQALDMSDPRVVFSESASALRNQSFETLLTGRAFERACINGERFTLCDTFQNERRKPKLYDHLEDPGLTRDVAARFPEEVDRLQRARRHWPPESARYRAAIRGRFKLVQTPRLDGGYVTSLHDRRSDPAEEIDVTEKHPEIARSLLEELDAWTRDTQYRPSLPDPEVTRGLRELGYIQ